MKLLAWDTSSKAGTIVALEWDSNSDLGSAGLKIVTELSLNVDATHSERLLWAIHQVLESARWKLEEIDYFGVGVGPGSFTGLRIGVTTARTLSHSLKKPLIPVSSLAALARPVALHFTQSPSKTLVVAATDACKGELFALWGQAQAVQRTVIRSDEAENLWSSRVQEQVIEPEKLIEQVQKKLTGKMNWVVVGEGRHRYQEIWKQLPRSKYAEHSLVFADQIQGRYLGLLAWEAAQSQWFKKGLEVFPKYLRASDAELKLKAGLLKRQATSAD